LPDNVQALSELLGVLHPERLAFTVSQLTPQEDAEFLDDVRPLVAELVDAGLRTSPDVKLVAKIIGQLTETLVAWELSVKLAAHPDFVAQHEMTAHDSATMSAAEARALIRGR
jgi:hypothetical protein